MVRSQANGGTEAARIGGGGALALHLAGMLALKPVADGGGDDGALKCLDNNLAGFF